MIESDAVLAEHFVGCRSRVLVQAEQRVAEEVDGVMEPGIGVFVEYRLGVEQGLVPRDAHCKIAYGQRNVRDRRECCHVRSPTFRELCGGARGAR